MGLVKYDHEPLLAPGRHYLSLPQIEALCVLQFDGTARQHREKLFYALEGFIQTLLVAEIRCDAFVDGSFLTRKPEPDDVDVIVAVEQPVFDALPDDKKLIIEAVNAATDFAGVETWAMTIYPREHPYYGSALDGGNPGEAFGLEHGQYWLKGYVVVRVWEADVRNLICR